MRLLHTNLVPKLFKPKRTRCNYCGRFVRGGTMLIHVSYICPKKYLFNRFMTDV